jgi:hypothetical protein
VEKFLENSIISFVQILRSLGLNIGTAETLDALGAIKIIDLTDKKQFKSTLKATLIKDAVNYPLFDSAFEKFFTESPRRENQVEEKKEFAKGREEAKKELEFQDQHLDLDQEYIDMYGQLPTKSKEQIKDFLKKTSQGKNVTPKFKPIVENVIKGALEYHRTHSDLPQLIPFELTGVEEIDAVLHQIAHDHKRAGTSVTLDVTASAGMLPTRNFQTGICNEALGELDSEGYMKRNKGSVACMGCPVPCGKILKYQRLDGKEMILEGPEYETACLLGTNLGIPDFNFVAEANILCDNLGMDTISCGNIIGFIMELTEKNLLPEEFKHQGVRFGDKEGALKLMEDLAYCRGIGAWAQGGVGALADKIGGKCKDFAMHSKGLEFPAYDPRRGFGTALSYAVTPRGACHRRAWPPSREVLGPYPPYEIEGKGQMIKEQVDERNILHSLIACDFNFFAVPVSIDQYMEYIKAVLGIEFTKEELEMAVDRIETTIRYFNYCQGLTRKNDTMPKRILEEPMPEGPAQGKCVTKEGFENMLDQYYALRGWDKNGVPMPETLEKYGIKRGAEA